MTLLNSMDGIYFLAARSFESATPPVPSAVGALRAVTDCVGITTFAAWQTVEVSVVEGLPTLDPSTQDPAWESVVMQEVEVTEPLWLMNMEFTAVERTAAVHKLGRHQIMLLARRSEAVGNPWGRAPIEPPPEEHFLMLRFLG